MQIKGAAAYVKADLLNIEELYGMADMDEDLWRAACQPTTKEWYGCKPFMPRDLDPMKVKKALNRAIFYITAPAGKEFITLSDRFPSKSDELEEVKRESLTERLLHRNHGTRWTNLLAYLCLASFQDRDGTFPMFIQFNWDLALDRALYRWYKLQIHPESKQREKFEHLWEEYGCEQEGKRWLPWYGRLENGKLSYDEWPRLARPHGGINWISAEPVADSEENEKNGKPFEGSLLQKSFFELYPSTNKSIWVDTRPVYQDSPTESLWHGEYMEIVPPTWRKQATKPAFGAQWGHISQDLQNVRRIVFIGYSLPITDLYFRHFLALSLADNAHLPKVYVINPHIHKEGGVRDNFLDLFDPLAREGRLYGIEGRFGDPALFDLHRALSIAERIKP
jgi:hypothetical protein